MQTGGLRYTLDLERQGGDVGGRTETGVVKLLEMMCRDDGRIICLKRHGILVGQPPIPKNRQIRILARAKSAYGLRALLNLHGRLIMSPSGLYVSPLAMRPFQNSAPARRVLFEGS